MKKTLCIFIFITSFTALTAQDKTPKNAVSPGAITGIVENKKEYIRVTNGECLFGFRIKIHSGIDKDKASYTASKFKSIFNETPYYEKYQQPNFTVSVGDFKTKFEAYKFLQEVKSHFPLAFIVKEKIRLHRLK